MLKKYLLSNVFHAPEVGGAGGGADQTRVPINERPADGPGSGRSTLRQQLEKNFEEDRTRTEEPDEPKRKPQRSRAREETEEDTSEEPEVKEAADEGTEVAEGSEEEEASPQIAAPEAWDKEAKAAWAKVPPTVQKAVAKRETDMAKGVAELKGKYAEIDKVLGSPHRVELLRRTNKTQAQAVDQLFAWHEALAGKPELAFPALAESFGFDLRTIPGLGGAAPVVKEETKSDPVAAAADVIPPAVQQYITKLEQKLNGQLGSLQQSLERDSYNKTQSTLAAWAKDKQYFDEEVRQEMSRLLGSGLIPPLADGSVDATVLDNAYDRALWSLPTVRAKVLAEQEKAKEAARKAKADAEKKAQQDLANKARRASGSLVGGAPGAPVDAKKGKSGKSVAQSIREAINQVEGRE